MNKSKAITTAFKAAALMGVFSLISSAQAAFVTLPFPSPEGAVSLGGLTSIPAGTLLASRSSAYTDVFGSTGILNSYVVQTGGVGSPLDFYYQVVNTTPAPDPFGPGDEQISRISIQGGFPTTTVNATNSVAQTNVSPLTFLANASLQPAATADRGEPLITNGNLGFNFPAGINNFQTNPANIASGESSTFLVVRSTSTTFASQTARVELNGGTQELASFAAVPEPGSILFGLGMFGVAMTSRVRRQNAK